MQQSEQRDAWLGIINQHADNIIESFGGCLTFQDLGHIVTMAQHISQDVVDGNTSLSHREKIILLLEYVIDNTNTPWLDDSMSDPFMKAMVPSLVDYVMLMTTEAPISPTSDIVNVGTEDCIWHRCGSTKLFRC